jgi:hypothetical protein
VAKEPRTGPARGLDDDPGRGFLSRQVLVPIQGLVRALVLALLSIWVAACGPGGRPPADLEPVSHPDLAAAEPAVPDQIDPARARLEALLDPEGGPSRGEPTELAAAFGALGEIYHAYGLLDPARACYRNAARLAPDDAG